MSLILSPAIPTPNEVFSNFVYWMDKSPIALIGAMIISFIVLYFLFKKMESKSTSSEQKELHEEFEKIKKTPEFQKSLAEIQSPVKVQHGKTEVIKQMLNNAIKNDKGFVIIDAKSDRDIERLNETINSN